MSARTFRAFQYPNYRRFFFGQAISQCGTWMQSVTVGIVVLHLTNSGVALGLTTLAQFGPLLVLGSWIGLLCDRLDQHKLLVAVNGAGAVVAAVFAVVVLAGDPPLWAIFALTTASGIVLAVENPVRRVFVAELVDEDVIANATALNSTVMITAEAVGLAVAGLLIGGPGVGIVFVINAVSFVPQVALFARMDRRQLRRQARVARGKGQSWEGAAFAWRTPELRVQLVLMAAIGMFGFSAHTVALPLLATRDLHGDARTYTWLLTALSVGSLAGALASARRTSVPTRSLAKAAIAFGVCNGVMGLSPTALIAGLVALPVGFTVMISVAGMNASVQLSTPPQLRGRVMALVSIVLVGSGPIGGPIVGWVSEQFGAPAALVIGGVVAVAAGAASLVALRAHAVEEVAAGALAA